MLPQSGNGREFQKPRLQLEPDSSQGVSKGGLRLGIPWPRASWSRVLAIQVGKHQHHDTEEAEQAGRGPKHAGLGAMAWRSQPQMSASLMESHLNGPRSGWDASSGPY